MNKALNRTTVETTQRPVRILQFGEGNFLRGFVDWMVDILNEKTDFDGDIQIVQPIERGMASMINKQDGLYHTLLQGLDKGIEKDDVRLITAVRGVVDPYKEFRDYLGLAENPDLRFIVSNTTEAGIVHDPSDVDCKSLPNSFPGKLTLLLYQRFKHFKGASGKGCIIIPVELIDRNGEKLKEIVLRYVDKWQLSDEFKNWVLQENVFCNTLVDRIVPGYPKEEITAIQKRLGYNDNLVVKAEPFHLWVIEGPDHIQKELPFESAGLNVKFVKDLSPYRTRKVRILNGAHTAMVPVAYLAGLRTVKEAVETEPLASFVEKTIFEEILPTLDMPRKELEEFAEAVLERFKNPFIRHELISIALNSVSKFRVRVLPSLMALHQMKQKPPSCLTRALAALIVFYRGRYKGQEIAIRDDDEVVSFFKSMWERQQPVKIVRMVLANDKLWGNNLLEIGGVEGVVLKEVIELLVKETKYNQAQKV